jgi:hypothetical protein
MLSMLCMIAGLACDDQLTPGVAVAKLAIILADFTKMT